MGRYVVPTGTRTYYHNNVVGPSPHPTWETFGQNSLGLTPAGASSEASGSIGGNARMVFAASSPANEPNSAAWPTTGVYRYQFDCIATGADLVFGCLTLGGTEGHFGRINAAADTDLQVFEQDQAAFSGSGLHLASITDPAWTAGAADNRFGILVCCQRVTGHGNQSMTLQLGETDDFADGPWAAAPAGPADNSVFFGTNS